MSLLVAFIVGANVVAQIGVSPFGVDLLGIGTTTASMNATVWSSYDAIGVIPVLVISVVGVVVLLAALGLVHKKL